MIAGLRLSLLVALLAMAIGARAEPLLLGLPEPTVELALDEHLGPILHDLLEASGENSREADATIRRLISEGESSVRQWYGPTGRHMAAFQAKAAFFEWILGDTDKAVERGKSAVAIDRQMAANAAFFGRYVPHVPFGDTVPAVETVLDLFFDMAESETELGNAEQADRIRRLSFELAQAAFVSRAPRRAVSRLRQDAVMDEPLASTVRMVLQAARSIEAFASYNWFVAGGLFGDVGTPERTAADAEIERQDELVGQALSLLRKSGTDVVSILLPQSVPYDRLREHIEPDQALVVIARGEVRFHVFVATADNLSWHLSGDTWLDYVERIPAMRATMGLAETRGAAAIGPIVPAVSQTSFLAEAHWLFQSLFEASAAEIEGRRHLLLVAGDILSTFPFEALVVSPPGAATTYGDADWLVRHHSVTVVPVVESLIAASPKSDGGEPESLYLAFANPDYLASSNLPFRLPLTKTIETLAPLPDSAWEAETIAQLLPPEKSFVLSGNGANEPMLKRLSDEGLLAKFRFIHFATHGLIPDGKSDVTEPGLALSPMNELMTPADLTAARYFQMRPDGFLSDTEVTTLRLDADLVVLSACDTSTADAGRLEGFSGLASAFLVAGARSVMVTHWPIVSRAAVEIVTAAMGHVVDGEDPAEALRRAVLAAIAAGGERADPRYWAPFSVYGLP